MKFKDSTLLQEVLLKANYISKSDAEKAQKFIDKKKGSLVDFLFAENILNKDVLGQAIAEYYGLKYADLNSYIPSKEQVLRIPEGVAKKFKAVVFKENNKEVNVATENPEAKELPNELKKIFKGKKIVLSYGLAEDIEETFVHYQKSLEARFTEIINKDNKFAPTIIETIIEDALMFRASDIHFEPQEEEVIIRFRIDGVLQEVGRINKDNYENILNRIKIQGKMRIDEHSTPQDGAIRLALQNDKLVDLRISIVPTLGGENVVARILSEYVRSFSLPDIGFSEKNEEIILKNIKKPFGMILVVGPTGSGKTTTLYTILKLLNKSTVNITTIEDPVEYRIMGTNQIQVNKAANLTFGQGLRSIVRQDPDIILVGEIRDQETAEIAVNAALTGHLLLSTFHANDALTAVPRLLDMGIEPFLLSSTLEIIVAQRLVRKLCEQCRLSANFSKKEIKDFDPELADYFSHFNKPTIYKAKGCPVCNFTGYRGRTAVFEIIAVTSALQDLILKRPSAQDILNLAKKEGFRPMFVDGLEKVSQGLTTLEEIYRVAPPQK